MLRKIGVEETRAEKKSVSPPTRKTVRLILKENRDLKAALRQKNRELDAFIKVGKALTATLGFKKVLQVILSAARQLVRCEDWSLLLIDGNAHDLYYELTKRKHLKLLKKIRYKLGEGPAGWVAENGLPLLIPDFSKQKVYQPEQFYPHLKAKDLLCLPIIIKDEVIGVIQMFNHTGENEFSKNDLERLTKLLYQSSPAIERSDVYRKMSDLVITDDLTHLYNLRHLDRILENEIKRSRRYKSALSLIFIDLDYFKQVNDHHGHLMGSQVLVEVAGILVESLRAVDVIVRYGGDEFIALLPNTHFEKAGRVAERVRLAIREFAFLKNEGLSLQITASFGIAGYPEHADSRTDLICLADRAMYDSKAQGRDRVSLASK